MSCSSSISWASCEAPVDRGVISLGPPSAVPRHAGLRNVAAASAVWCGLSNAPVLGVAGRQFPTVEAGRLYSVGRGVGWGAAVGRGRSATDGARRAAADAPSARPLPAVALGLSPGCGRARILPAAHGAHRHDALTARRWLQRVRAQHPERPALRVATLDQLAGVSHRARWPQSAQYQPNRGAGTSPQSDTSWILFDAGRHSNQRGWLHTAQ
jgi:hypothetical protein